MPKMSHAVMKFKIDFFSHKMSQFQVLFLCLIALKQRARVCLSCQPMPYKLVCFDSVKLYEAIFRVCVYSFWIKHTKFNEPQIFVVNVCTYLLL